MPTLLAPATKDNSTVNGTAPVPAPTTHTYTLHPDERISYMLHIDEAELARLRTVLKEQITFMWGRRNDNPFVRPMLKQVIHLALAARDAWEITADVEECPRYRRPEVRATATRA